MSSMKMSVNMNHWANAPNAVLPVVNAARSHWTNAIRSAGVQGEGTVCLTQSDCLSTKAPALETDLIKCLWARHWSVRASGPCSDLLKKVHLCMAIERTLHYVDWVTIIVGSVSWSMLEDTVVTTHVSLTLCALSLCILDVCVHHAVYCR